MKLFTKHSLAILTSTFILYSTLVLGGEYNYSLTDSTHADTTEEIEELQLGSQALDLNLPDLEGNKHKISSVNAKYTILFFYSAMCGHCKKTAPKLIKMYNKYEKELVSIYAVEATNDKGEWQAFIDEFELDGINVADLDRSSNYRKYYGVTSFPTIYLLDKDKKIILKKASVKDLDNAIKQNL